MTMRYMKKSGKSGCPEKMRNKDLQGTRAREIKAPGHAFLDADVFILVYASDRVARCRERKDAYASISRWMAAICAVEQGSNRE